MRRWILILMWFKSIERLTPMLLFLKRIGWFPEALFDTIKIQIGLHDLIDIIVIRIITYWFSMAHFEFLKQFMIHSYFHLLFFKVILTVPLSRSAEIPLSLSEQPPAINVTSQASIGMFFIYWYCPSCSLASVFLKKKAGLLSRL